MYIAEMPNGTLRLSPEPSSDGLKEIEYTDSVDFSHKLSMIDGKLVSTPIESVGEIAEENEPSEIEKILDAIIQ